MANDGEGVGERRDPRAAARSDAGAAVAAGLLVPALVLRGAGRLPDRLHDLAAACSTGAARLRRRRQLPEMFDRDATRTAIKNNVIWVIVAPALATSSASSSPCSSSASASARRSRRSSSCRWRSRSSPPASSSGLCTTRTPTGPRQRHAHHGHRRSGRRRVSWSAQPVRSVWRRAAAADRDRPARSRRGRGAARRRRAPTRRGARRRPTPAATAGRARDAVVGTVWLDFRRGGGGDAGRSTTTRSAWRASRSRRSTPTAGGGDGDHAERRHLQADRARPGRLRGRAARVELRHAVERAFNLLGRLADHPRRDRRRSSWIWTGFAMVVIAAGLAAIPRETAGGGARRRRQRVAGVPPGDVPLLWPVILVVLVTLVINVLKIFDLVLIVPPGNVQDDANVIALELWRVGLRRQRRRAGQRPRRAALRAGAAGDGLQHPALPGGGAMMATQPVRPDRARAAVAGQPLYGGSDRGAAVPVLAAADRSGSPGLRVAAGAVGQRRVAAGGRRSPSRASSRSRTTATVRVEARPSPGRCGTRCRSRCPPRSSSCSSPRWPPTPSP